MGNNIGKSAAILTVSNVITMLIGMVSAMLLSRCYTLEEYGTYSQINMVIALATSFFMLGLPNSLNYFLARAESSVERSDVLSVYFTLCTLLSVLMGVALYISVPAIVLYFNNPLIKAFTFVLVTLPWSKTIISSIGNVLIVYQNTNKLIQVNIINACSSIISVIVVQLLGWSFMEYMLLYTMSQTGITLWIYTIIRKAEKGVYLRVNKELVKRIFSYSIPIGLSALVGTVNIEIDKLMIARLYDTESLAIYTNAAKELPLTVVATSLTAVLLPQVSRRVKADNIKDAVSLWGKATEISYTFMCFAVTALIVFAPQIMSLFYSEKYLAGVSVFCVYSLVLLLRTTYFGMILNALGETKSVLAASVITLTVNVVLNYLCFLLFGFIGPAIATFVSILTAAYAQLIKTSKLISVPVRRLFPWRHMLYHTILNISWAVPVYWLIQKVGLGTHLLDIGICIIIGMFITVGYILAEKRHILRLWKELNET